MDMQDYIQKSKNFLEQPTVRPITSDPTNKYKAKLINILKRIKGESAMDGHHVQKNVSNWDLFSKVLWSSKKPHTLGHPQRPIVSSQNSITYGVAKELPSILQPFGRQVTTPHTKHTRLCTKSQEHYTRNRGMHNI